MLSVRWLSSLITGAAHNINDLRPAKTVCKLPYEERLAGLRYHPNLLIEGPEVAIEETLVGLASDFYEEVYQWHDAAAERLDREGVTVIVKNVEDLDGPSQKDLEAWIERAGRGIQVVSASSVSIFERVQQGSFRVGLYYRLNTLRLVLDQSPPDVSRRADH